MDALLEFAGQAPAVHHPIPLEPSSATIRYKGKGIDLKQISAFATSSREASARRGTECAFAAQLADALGSFTHRLRLAHVHMKLGHFAEADVLAAGALGVLQRALRADHPQTIEAEDILGNDPAGRSRSIPPSYGATSSDT